MILKYIKLTHLISFLQHWHRWSGKILGTFGSRALRVWRRARNIATSRARESFARTPVRGRWLYEYEWKKVRLVLGFICYFVRQQMSSAQNFVICKMYNLHLFVYQLFWNLNKFKNLLNYVIKNSILQSKNGDYVKNKIIHIKDSTRSLCFYKYFSLSNQTQNH